MKKFVAIIAAVIVIGGTASAVDMNKKIGFGVGPYPGGSIWEPAYFSMRVGVGPVVIEPSVLYSLYTSDNEIDSLKITNSDIGFSIRGLFPFIKKEKSNLYGTFGFGFDMLKDIYDYYTTSSSKITNSTTTYGIPLGLALEHFVTPNFSVCISSENFFGGSSEENKMESGGQTTTTKEPSITNILLGNLYFSLMFFWYL